MTLLARLCPSSLNHLRRDGSMASMAFMPFTSMPIPAPLGLYCLARSRTYAYSSIEGWVS